VPARHAAYWPCVDYSMLYFHEVMVMFMIEVPLRSNKVIVCDRVIGNTNEKGSLLTNALALC
jgi:hypothetical protein